jgi:hypothetical protein
LLATAFRSWCGDLREARVFFTPDVLVAIDARDRRGYLFDDGWFVEVFIEIGAARFESQLANPEESRDEMPDGPATCQGLLSMALDKGEPYEAVQHLI